MRHGAQPIERACGWDLPHESQLALLQRAWHMYKWGAAREAKEAPEQRGEAADTRR